MSIYLRHKINISAIPARSQPLGDPFYCFVLLSSKWKFSWHIENACQPPRRLIFTYSPPRIEWIALLTSFHHHSNDFTMCFRMSLLSPVHTRIFSGGKFEPILIDNAYKAVMRLNIKSVSQSDFGSYRCVAKNSLGDTDGTIKLYSEQQMMRGESLSCVMFYFQLH